MYSRKSLFIARALTLLALTTAASAMSMAMV
jgi:hypothetical protein